MLVSGLCLPNEKNSLARMLLRFVLRLNLLMIRLHCVRIQIGIFYELRTRFSVMVCGPIVEMLFTYLNQHVFQMKAFHWFSDCVVTCMSELHQWSTNGTNMTLPFEIILLSCRYLYAKTKTNDFSNTTSPVKIILFRSPRQLALTFIYYATYLCPPRAYDLF